MNKNDLIDNALKEHARLENKDDQDFLDQLEGKIDAQNLTELKEEESRSGTGKFFWPAIAATVVVSAVAISPMFKDEPPVVQVASERNVSMNLSSKEPELKGDDRMASLDRRKMTHARPENPDGAGSALVTTGPAAEGKGKKGLDPFGNDQDPSGKESSPLLAQNENKGRGRPGGAKDHLQVDLSRSEMPVPATSPSRPRGGETDFSIQPAPSTISPAKKSRGSVALQFGDEVNGRAFGIDRDRSHSGDKYGALIEGGFLTPLSSPLSTFSIDVDTASYSNIRRHIMNGQGLNPNAVRIEEMINYFDYQYAQPEDEHPFSVHTEVASCPWNPKHRLVRIGLQGEKIEEGERKAANLVFLLDVSGSMNSPDKLPLLVQSFQILLKQLNENDRVSLVVYAGRQAVLLNPTAIDEDGRAQVSDALKRLSAGGSTAGAAGIRTAYDLARKGFVEGGVNRVILATDGDFNVGVTNHNELLKLVKNQAEGNISLTVLGFGQGNLNDAMMEKLTNSGDGNYFYIDSLREGQKVFQQGLTGTIQTIAKDVKIQVEFNPGKVGQYRLIGYANRRLKDEDFKNDKVDAGDIGAGHRVTALYEIVPAGVMAANDLKYQKVREEPKLDVVDSPEMLTVKLRYKQPDGDVSTEIAQALTDEGNVWEMASEDFRFSSGVALWGMLLRNSNYAGGGTPELVSELALGGQGDDLNGDRAELLDLLRRWSSRR